MKMPRIIYTLPISILILSGCTTLTSEIDGLSHPQDTAILIDDTPYQINTTQCAKINSIDPDGTLDCHNIQGVSTIKMTPISTWRRNYIKEKLGYDWASPEHQAYLYNYFHNGGKQRATENMVNSLQQSLAIYNQAKGLSDTLKKSREIESQAAMMRIEGSTAYYSGGMSAWQIHQTNTIQWHLNNINYFKNELNNSSRTLIK